MLNDLAVPHAHGVDGFKVNPSTGGLHPQEWPLMRSVIRLIRRHEISVGSLPMDFSVEVGERAAKNAVQLSRAVSVRSPARLGRMVYEGSREELLEQVEVSTALHFFGVTADDRLRGIT